MGGSTAGSIAEVKVSFLACIAFLACDFAFDDFFFLALLAILVLQLYELILLIRKSTELTVSSAPRLL